MVCLSYFNNNHPYPLIPRPPSHLPPHSTFQPVAESLFELLESYSKFPRAIYFTYGNRTGHGTTDWFQLGKEVCQGCILSPCLFNLYAWETLGWKKHKLESRLPGEISITIIPITGIFQARILEWVAISFSRVSSQPRDQTRVSHIVVRCFTVWATRRFIYLFSFLAMLGLHCWTQAFSSCSEQGLLFVAMCRFLNVVASLVEHEL